MLNQSRGQVFCLRAKQSLRFRRWSRKSSAVFHSLHTSVGIGRLSTAIVRRLEHKTLKLSVGFVNGFGIVNSLSSRDLSEAQVSSSLVEGDSLIIAIEQALCLGQKSLIPQTYTQKNILAQAKGFHLQQILNLALEISSVFGLISSAFLWLKRAIQKDYLND